MPRVNLIAERRQKEKRQALTARAMLYGCGGCASLFLCVAIGTTCDIRAHEAKIQSVDAELQSRQQSIAHVKQLQDEVGKLEPKLTLLNTAKSTTRHWYLLFQQTGQGLPPTSWLDTLTINHDDRSLQDSLVLSGQSMTTYTVADTLRHLAGQSLFQKIDLHYVTQSPTELHPGVVQPVRFEVGIQVTPPAQKDPQGVTQAK